MIKEYVLITVIIGFITHAMLWTINLYKVKMNLGTKFLVLKKFFLFCYIEKKKSNISKNLNKPSPSLVKLINELNNVTEERKHYDENLPNCQYRDLGPFQISQKSLKVNHCLYFILTFSHYQRILMIFVYYLKKLI